MFKALLVEIKNSITKSFFHFLRFGGLLIIPFIYGFSYIYAFYDPFEAVDQVKVSVITQKGDFLGDALGKQLSKSNKIAMGDIDMTMKMEHLYQSDVNVDEVKKDSYATLTIGSLDTVDQMIIDYIKNNIATSSFDKIALKAKILLELGKILSPSGTDKTLINFNLNFKKSYLLAFGIDAGASMYSTIQFVEKQILRSLQDPSYISHLATEAGTTTTEIANALNTIAANGLSDVEPVHIEAHMGEHAKYGYGLAPFFISVAMWVGGMVMTFAIHRKIYDKTISAGTRYLAKWLLMAFGIVAQATVLMVGLYLIGFNELGLDHWGALYGGAIISGLIFMSIIQAIRFTIHNRAIGILLSIMLLVLQMASGGGLFPIETQSEFYNVVNKIVPMGRTVTILRELSFDTDWSNVFINFGYLAIWLYMIPLGVYINHRRTINIYREQNWKLPPSMAYREQVRLNRRKGRDK